jgi:ribosomal protein S18 acetylase RimI-like enzyme
MIKIHDLTTPSDPLLCFWLNLLQRQFPIDEQVSAGSILRMVQEKEQGEGADNHIWVALNETTQEPVGMTWFDIEHNGTALWYIAVATGLEGHGYGSLLMKSIADKVFNECNCDFMVMEVENQSSHAHHNTEEDRAKNIEQIKKRNSFYMNRHGAWLIKGIKYSQQAGFSAAIPMDLLITFHPDKPVPTAEQAFAMCKQIFGDSLTQDGELSLSKEAG